MKCKKCEKPATFHITEITSGKPAELHLCEDCARDYLTQPDPETPPTGSGLAGALAQQMALGQTTEELDKLNQQSCPVCGITFYEFRNQGRLGCPHDYVVFWNELEPLILNIHGETKHVGKTPRRSPVDSDQRTKLIQLRREMKEAINDEDYERASEIRDKIRQIETQASPSE